MKFKVTDARATDYEPVELNTIDELLAWVEDAGSPVIVHPGDPPELEIYNGYRE